MWCIAYSFCVTIFSNLVLKAFRVAIASHDSKCIKQRMHAWRSFWMTARGAYILWCCNNKWFTHGLRSNCICQTIELTYTCSLDIYSFGSSCNLCSNELHDVRNKIRRIPHSKREARSWKAEINNRVYLLSLSVLPCRSRRKVEIEFGIRFAVIAMYNNNNFLFRFS